MNKLLQLLHCLVGTKNEAKVKKQPLSAENALCLYNSSNSIFSTTPKSLQEMVERHLESVLNDIAIDAKTKTYSIYYFDEWMNEKGRTSLIENLKSLGYIIKYQDENLYIVSWKREE